MPGDTGNKVRSSFSTVSDRTLYYCQTIDSLQDVEEEFNGKAVDRTRVEGWASIVGPPTRRVGGKSNRPVGHDVDE